MTQHKSVDAGHTPGPWFVSGVRFRMNGGEWHSVNRYDQDKKQDENIACVGFDPRTGVGLADARLIAAAPALYEALVEAKRELWSTARSQWNLSDFKNFAVVQQIDAALSSARGES